MYKINNKNNFFIERSKRRWRTHLDFT